MARMSNNPTEHPSSSYPIIQTNTMLSSSLLFLSLAGAFVSAFPYPVTSTLTRREGEMVCGTTQDADLASCQAVLDQWTGSLVTTNTCQFGGFFRGYNTAYNVASVPGCEYTTLPFFLILSLTSTFSLKGSVYVAGPDGAASKEPAAVKEAVQNLMGCADTAGGKVNGVTTLSDGTFICLGGNDGCSE